MIRKSFNIIAAILIVSFGVLITLLHYLTPPQWPTIITSLMFPVLLFVYYRLSKREENEMSNLFGDEIHGKDSDVYSEIRLNKQKCTLKNKNFESLN